jgi:hypothetical protein
MARKGAVDQQRKCQLQLYTEGWNLRKIGSIMIVC